MDVEIDTLQLQLLVQEPRRALDIIDLLAFHREGLIWGAISGNQVDLHHFELP